MQPRDADALDADGVVAFFIREQAAFLLPQAERQRVGEHPDRVVARQGLQIRLYRGEIGRAVLLHDKT